MKHFYAEAKQRNKGRKRTQATAANERFAQDFAEEYRLHSAWPEPKIHRRHPDVPTVLARLCLTQSQEEAEQEVQIR